MDAIRVASSQIHNAPADEPAVASYLDLATEVPVCQPRRRSKFLNACRQVAEMTVRYTTLVTTCLRRPVSGVQLAAVHGARDLLHRVAKRLKMYTYVSAYLPSRVLQLRTLHPVRIAAVGSLTISGYVTCRSRRTLCCFALALPQLLLNVRTYETRLPASRPS